MSSKTNETTGDRVCGGHLSNAVVHQTKEASVDGVGEEQAAGAALVKTATDTDEEGSTDGATNGHKLDLSISQASVKVIGVLDDLALLMAVGASDGLGRDIVVDLLAMLERCHVGGRW